MESFEDLEVWKASMRLCVEVYGQFKDCRDFGFRDQICRSSLSIPSNIAEGYERNSDKEFIRFLNIALGSGAELRTQLYLALQMQRADPQVLGRLIQNSKTLSRQITQLIVYRKSKLARRGIRT